MLTIVDAHCTVAVLIQSQHRFTMLNTLWFDVLSVDALLWL
jgi:hypothetical protein